MTKQSLWLKKSLKENKYKTKYEHRIYQKPADLTRFTYEYLPELNYYAETSRQKNSFTRNLTPEDFKERLNDWKEFSKQQNTWSAHKENLYSRMNKQIKQNKKSQLHHQEIFYLDKQKSKVKKVMK